MALSCFVYLSVDGHLGHFYFLAVMNNIVMTLMNMFLCERIFSILLVIYLEVEFLDYD